MADGYKVTTPEGVRWDIYRGVRADGTKTLVFSRTGEKSISVPLEVLVSALTAIYHPNRQEPSDSELIAEAVEDAAVWVAALGDGALKPADEKFVNLGASVMLKKLADRGPF